MSNPNATQQQPQWEALRRIADTVRVLAAEAVEQAKSGHPGMPIGFADIGALLYGSVLKHDPSQPKWPDRDRLVLSAGHGSMWLYALLHLSGYDLPLDELRRFRQLGSRTPGHPEWGVTPGVETTTGPLGQGLGNAVGMALAERHLAERFNRPGYPVVDHFTFCVAGDGDMMEGVASEAASLAGHLGLGRLIVLYDSNRISIEGETQLAFTESVADRFRAYGWHVQEVDAYDLPAVLQAIESAKAEGERPSLIVAHSHIGKGTAKQDSAKAHGEPLGADVVKALKEALGWPEEPFYVPQEVYDYFAEGRKAWAEARRRWDDLFERWSGAYPELRAQWDAAMEGAGRLPEGLERKPWEAMPAYEVGARVATREAGGKALNALAAQVPSLVGGSADLAPSTKTYLNGQGSIARGSYGGRNIHFGVREHGMGAILNGMALHGGLRPFGSTFLVFSDYMRPSIRLAALMGLPVVYVFTHDSIYVGEDGPTHQPVEHAEALRLIPNLDVWRPADGFETNVAWVEALRRREGPTALLLSRQGLPVLERGVAGSAAGSAAASVAGAASGAASGPDDPEATWRAVARGGYVLSPEEGGGGPEVTLVASGSEVSLVVEVARALRERGTAVRVVSMPCREVFLRQDAQYRRQVIPEAGRRVFVEAAVPDGWYRLAQPGDLVYGLRRFGESGPAPAVAKHLGLSVEAVLQAVLGAVQGAAERAQG